MKEGEQRLEGRTERRMVQENTSERLGRCREMQKLLALAASKAEENQTGGNRLITAAKAWRGEKQ